MPSLPNVLTLIRLALVPVTGYCLATGQYQAALPIFLLAALTDLADGYIARRFNLTSRLGAALDPVADKLNMLVATVGLAWQLLIPLWLAIAIVARDLLIVAGALAYRALAGRITIAPTRLSKINTFLEFTLLLLVMAAAAGWIDIRPWQHAAFVIVFATIVLSGVQYAWEWGRKALEAGRHR